MIEIYAISINENYPKNEFETIIKFLCKEKQEKLKRLKFFEDALRTLAGEIIIRNIVKRKYKINFEDIIFKKNINGKPYIDNIKGFHFNISHSGKWVVCAISDALIGIDIEKIKETNFKVAKRFFSEEEYIDLSNKESVSKTEYFYDIWTLKEAYLKAIGTGLTVPLRSFTLKKENKDICIKTKDKDYNWNFNQYEIDKDYKLSLCAENEGFPCEIKKLTLDEIIDEFNDINIKI